MIWTTTKLTIQNIAVWEIQNGKCYSNIWLLIGEILRRSKISKYIGQYMTGLEFVGMSIVSSSITSRSVAVEIVCIRYRYINQTHNHFYDFIFTIVLFDK